MPTDLEASYRHCAELARRRGKNFYYSFLCLPPEQRAAMCAVYAFFRLCDDISDDGHADGAVRMQRWRQALDQALAGECSGHPVLPAFAETVRRFRIPARYFHELIDGAERDLHPVRMETFDQTYRYCYQVASTVGLVCIHIWGFESEEALELAEWNGIAFQLTNILRDLGEDASRGRLYLPAEDLKRFGYSQQEMAAGVENAALRDLVRFEVERTRDFYRRSEPLVELVGPQSRPCLVAMRRIYGGILDSIVQQDGAVLSRRARIPTWRKLMIATEAWWQARTVRGRELSGTSL